MHTKTKQSKQFQQVRKREEDVVVLANVKEVNEMQENKKE
jgi:hypothetical protein